MINDRFDYVSAGPLDAQASAMHEYSLLLFVAFFLVTVLIFCIFASFRPVGEVFVWHTGITGLAILIHCETLACTQIELQSHCPYHASAAFWAAPGRYMGEFTTPTSQRVQQPGMRRCAVRRRRGQALETRRCCVWLGSATRLQLESTRRLTLASAFLPALLGGSPKFLEFICSLRQRQPHT